jgi:Flp pilus assembly protein CpaB
LKRSNRLILLIGVFLAAVAFVFIVLLLQGSGGGNTGSPGSSAPPAKIATVIAARDIPLGVKITPDMVTTEDLDPAARNAGALVNTSQAIGNIARQSITTGQQITTVAFADVNTNVEVPAGFTAIAVQVDQVTGAGTLIKKGDYVDVIAQINPTFPVNYFAKVSDPAPVPEGAGAKTDATSVKVLLQGLQVVATLLPPAPAPASGVQPTPAPQSGGSDNTALNGQQEIVILAATAQQEEVIKFAQVDGNISLTLRSPQDFFDANGNPIVPPTVKTTGLVLKTMIDNWGVLPPLPIIIPAPSPAR